MINNGRLKFFFREWIFPILIAALISFALMKFGFYLARVPSGSMIPTIQIGDTLLVVKNYNRDHLKNGDVVVFYSKELDELLVKRLIGIPKDEIEIFPDGTVYVNNKKLQEKYVENNKSLTMHQKFSIPEDKYFFLGDNRDDSWDARYWDNPYIDSSDIDGVAKLVVYPFKRIGKLK